MVGRAVLGFCGIDEGQRLAAAVAFGTGQEVVGPGLEDPGADATVGVHALPLIDDHRPARPGATGT